MKTKKSPFPKMEYIVKHAIVCLRSCITLANFIIYKNHVYSQSHSHHHMQYEHLSVWECYERKQRIYFLLYDHNIDFDKFSHEKSIAERQIRKRLTMSSTLTTFLHAALIIRKNPTQWKNYLKNPSRRPPKIFDPVVEDKLLIFYLYFCDKLKIFHLDPRYPFLICEKIEKCTFIINGKSDRDLGIIKDVIEMWKSMGSPLSESEYGVEVSRIAELLKNPSSLKARREPISIGWFFWELTRQFGFHSSLTNSGTSMSTEKGYLDMPYFVIEASIAIAFDKNEVNTLELIYELFPQFPEFIPNAVRAYYLSFVNCDRIGSNFGELSQNAWNNISIADSIISEIFNTRDVSCDIDENTLLRNQTILKTIDEHPKLFTRWAVDAKMRKLYRRLIDPKTLYY